LVPHLHAPLASQLSARVELQDVQGPPLIPQLLDDLVLQVPVGLVQQPFGHEVLSQTQLSFTQR